MLRFANETPLIMCSFLHRNRPMIDLPIDVWKRTFFTRLGFQTIASIAVVGACTFPASAQQSALQGRIPVLVVLLDTLPVRGSKALIAHRENGSPKDAILLTRESATARQLSAAVFTLLVLHEASPDTPVPDGVVNVKLRQGPTPWIETEERRAEAIVRRLHGSTPQNVPGYGIVHSAKISVSSRAIAAKLRPIN